MTARDPRRHPGLGLPGLEQLLPDEDRKLLEQVREHLTTHVEPVINHFWTRAAFPHDLVPGIAALGIAGLHSTARAAPVAAACSTG